MVRERGAQGADAAIVASVAGRHEEALGGGPRASFAEEEFLYRTPRLAVA
jgi:hypothetical protein